MESQELEMQIINFCISFFKIQFNKLKLIK
jgi:hypothetical protein